MRCSIGQDSHRFEETYTGKPLILGGYTLPPCDLSLSANSDGDVILHALTNAISGITCRNILGKPADDLCKAGVIDSGAYLKLALEDLKAMGDKIIHVSFTVECKKPHLSAHIPAIRQTIADLCGIEASQIGMTATTGEGLTDFGRGLGISVFCILTVGD
ncbi:MAG: 2-C-methyl-D-erythritol 2,4-cyclodiphosphate synthase [Clostridia bacterium]|nr:2-C-methyl-D-erythritol 2,4-cyclodiphosphate synthase [Clostridia bacterium]